KAIGNGFSPENAFLLLKEEYMFEVIPFRAETPESRKRLFARVIGRDGLVKKNLEEKTNSLISIYGKNVSIIAEENHMLDAERAVKNLLSGKSHGHVYKLAERKKTS
ncbi:MAG: RNA-processing protein, partial [Nanoarchaeota archaeon]|nr:RNA-processing protein [Nanoarchaeota archaeon]